MGLTGNCPNLHGIHWMC